MTSFLSAVSFLSILPVPKNRPFESRMVAHFPLVGLLIGGLLVGVDWVGALIFPTYLRCAVDVLFLAVVTGALHLDGLADSADGLFSHRPRDRVLEIMKDPHVGVMGVLAVVFCILLKIVGIKGIGETNLWLWLLLAPTLARASQVIGLLVMQDARENGGIGSPLYQKGNYRILLACLVPLAIPFLFHLRTGILMLVVFASSTAVLLIYFQYRIGGMTGDTFGAMTEIVETLLLTTGAVDNHFFQSMENASF
jgi:adenosylcobinamide-GDP ribazoletransferase